MGSFGVGGDQRYYVLSTLSGSAQLGPTQARREFGAVSAIALFYVRLCAVDFAWLSAIPRADGARAHSANVRREEYDVRVGSAPRPLSDSVCDVPRSDEHEGGRRADAECAE